jgi:mannosyltransferase OCH1-like enzyme
MIPKKIFQSHKSYDYIKNNEFLRNAVNSWRKYDKEFEYVFHNDVQADKFMLNNFKGRIYNWYKKLPLPVMKGDLWRYCILYKYGGIYADADTVCLKNPNLFIKNNADMVISPEPHPYGHTQFCQWVWSVPPNSPILKIVIDLCIKRLQDEEEGITNKIKEVGGGKYVLYSTGPHAFTTGIETYLKRKNLPTFDDKRKYVNYPNEIIHVFPQSFHNDTVQHGFMSITSADGWHYQSEKISSIT